MPRSRRIPLNIISGPLGVGKTSAILHYVKEQAGTANIGVLVNDFGSLGLDGIILGEGSDNGELTVESIPGGCLCCTSGAGFIHGIQKLARDPAIDRILIEPSGMVILTQLKELLRTIIQDEPVEIYSIISLIHPGRMKPSHFEALPFFMQFVRESDILVANGEDRCTEQQLKDFLEWAQNLTPPVEHILTTSFGKLPAGLLDIRNRNAADNRDTTDVHHEHAVRGDLTAEPEQIFHKAQIRSLLEQTITSEEPPLLRFKGIIHTDQGWINLQTTHGQIDEKEARPATRSVMEWILAESTDGAAFKTQIESCRIMDAAQTPTT